MPKERAEGAASERRQRARQQPQAAGGRAWRCRSERPLPNGDYHVVSRRSHDHIEEKANHLHMPPPARREPDGHVVCRSRFSLSPILPSGGWGKAAPRGCAMWATAGAPRAIEGVTLSAALAPVSPPKQQRPLNPCPSAHRCLAAETEEDPAVDPGPTPVAPSRAPPAQQRLAHGAPLGQRGDQRVAAGRAGFGCGAEPQTA
jgi:hypothetical protein